MPGEELSTASYLTGRLALDGEGRIEVAFDHPQVGLSYGIQWFW